MTLLLLACALTLGEQPLAEYPGAPATRIGADLTIGGELYRLGYFTTDDSIETVLKHFNQAWEESGYPVTVDRTGKEQVIISAFYTRQGLVRSIVLSRHAGKTLGFTVLKDLWVKVKASKPDQLPLLEGALVSNDLVTRSELGGTQHRTAALPLGLDAAVKARQTAWAELGYVVVRDTKLKREEDGVTQRVLDLQRPGPAGEGAQGARGKAGTESQASASITLVAVDPGTTAIDETWVGLTPKKGGAK